MLRDTLVEVMNEKSIENITVKDLTERADLNRGTFYLHYSDLFDLLEQSENEMIQEMSELLSKIFYFNFMVLIVIPILVIIITAMIFVIKILEETLVEQIELAQDNVKTVLDGEIEDSFLSLSHFLLTNDNQVLELISQVHADIFLTDINMPVMNGIVVSLFEQKQSAMLFPILFTD